MNKDNKNQNNDSVSNQQLGMLALGGLALFAWQKEALIKQWLYQNLLFLTMGGIAILAALGFYLWHRFKKKEAEYFERRRALKRIETKNQSIDYYKRKGP